MKLFAAIATLLLAIVAAAQTVCTFGCNDCTGGTGELAVTSASITPNPLCAGQNACFTATGSLSVPITAGGNFVLVGKYLGRTIYTDTQDLCTLLAANGYNCPVPTSATSITLCFLVKANVPINVSGISASR